MRTKIMLLAAIAMAGFVTPIRAQVETVTLRVDGLACPFCAYGVEKKSKRLDGVRSVDVKINEGKVILEWRANQPLNMAALDNAIYQAGFTLRGVKVKLAGVLRMEDGKWYLQLPPPMKQRFELSQTSGSPFQKRLSDLSDKGQPVRIFGSVHQRPKNKQASPVLEIEDLNERSSGSREK